jgi:hypothetical protein
MATQGVPGQIRVLAAKLGEDRGRQSVTAVSGMGGRVLHPAEGSKGWMRQRHLNGTGAPCRAFRYVR